MELTLLRHAETEGSRLDLYYGAADIPALPESLRELREKAGSYPAAKRFYTSGLLRTEQTLEALYGPVSHTRLPGLQEMNYGDFEMKSGAQLQNNPDFITWNADPEHNICPNGESQPQTLRRNLEAIAPVLAAGEDAVCILHGGVTAGLMMSWFGGEREDYALRPGTGYTVRFEGGRPLSYRKAPQE